MNSNGSVAQIVHGSYVSHSVKILAGILPRVALALDCATKPFQPKPHPPMDSKSKIQHSGAGGWIFPSGVLL